MGTRGGEEVEQVLLGVPRSQYRYTDFLEQALELSFEFGDQVTGHPGRRAGQPVAQLLLPDAFASAPTAELRGDPAADLGHGGVGQLHDMEMINDELGVRRRLPDRGLEHRAYIDGHESHLVTPRIRAGQQPVGHDLGGAAFELPE